LQTTLVGTTATLVLLASACRFDPTGLVPPEAGLPDAGCADTCGPGGALRCTADRSRLEICAAPVDACRSWTSAATCEPDGWCADATADASAHCAPCEACTVGDATCPEDGGTLREVCSYTGSGFCSGWETQTCDPGTRCQPAAVGEPATCASCLDCAEAEPVCDASGLSIERCDLDAATGCRAIGAYACEAGMSCAPGTGTEVCGRDAMAGPLDPGSTAYPTRTVGNQATGTGPVAKDHLVGDRYTLEAPLTVRSIHTYGTAGGHAKVSIYDHDAVNDVPGNRLLPEVATAVATNAWTIIDLPAPVFLPAGTYWIVFNVDKAQAITYSAAEGGVRVFRALTYPTAFPATGGTGFTRSTSMDSTYLTGVAIQGYAKATRITVAEPTVEASALAFHAHDAGNVRLALYDDQAGPRTLRWESGATVALAGEWLAIPITAGIPATLNLPAGTYWLVWQWDATTAGPGLLAGAAGDGQWLARPFGPLPGIWSGGTPSDETWSVHLTYTVSAPPVGW
jgi:hypothetical protein